ncbi:non-homologous end-joining DNA ligase [Georgenia sp. Z1491]|uniref:non-homologous end-joining DNA ligase n=1 Tax=Georgenia sp. Z1491 TaxID=3416707 RepID=UPI003CF48F73
MARSKDREAVRIDGREVRLSHPDKVMYPETGTTKRDLVDYVVAMAELIGRHAGGRPATRKRWPDGVGTTAEPGQSFFAKDLEGHAPDWVARRDQQHADHVNTYPLADDAATLAWFVQMGTLEIHVPQWRFGPGEKEELAPDRLVLDLDPGEGAGLAECVEVARLLRPELEERGLTSVPVTSGSKGLHLYAGLDGHVTGDDVAETMEDLAQALEGERPELVVSTIRRDVRRGRVLIDWSQNRAARTTVAPYSPRGRGLPTVAVPRVWYELDDPDLRQLTIDEVLARMRGTQDPLAAIAPLPDGAGSVGGARLPVRAAGASARSTRRTPDESSRRGDGTMPQKDTPPSIKNPEMYEELRDDGASKEKAARISNAAANEGRKRVGARGGEAGSYDDWTVDELKDRAKELGITGYSDKKKDELVDMLRNH